jgi:hypothetical protein
MQPTHNEKIALRKTAEVIKRPDQGISLTTLAEGSLATLGIKIIRILITGLAERITAIPNLRPAEITAGTLDVQTVATDIPTAEKDVPTAGTNATIAVTDSAIVNTTEILETILEIVARKTVTEITEAAETRGRGQEK